MEGDKSQSLIPLSNTFIFTCANMLLQLLVSWHILLQKYPKTYCWAIIFKKQYYFTDGQTGCISNYTICIDVDCICTMSMWVLDLQWWSFISLNILAFSHCHIDTFISMLQYNFFSVHQQNVNEIPQDSPLQKKVSMKRMKKLNITKMTPEKSSEPWAKGDVDY